MWLVVCVAGPVACSVHDGGETHHALTHLSTGSSIAVGNASGEIRKKPPPVINITIDNFNNNTNQNNNSNLNFIRVDEIMYQPPGMGVDCLPFHLTASENINAFEVLGGPVFLSQISSGGDEVVSLDFTFPRGGNENQVVVLVDVVPNYCRKATAMIALLPSCFELVSVGNGIMRVTFPFSFGMGWMTVVHMFGNGFLPPHYFPMAHCAGGGTGSSSGSGTGSSSGSGTGSSSGSGTGSSSGSGTGSSSGSGTGSSSGSGTGSSSGSGSSTGSSSGSGSGCDSGSQECQGWNAGSCYRVRGAKWMPDFDPTPSFPDLKKTTYYYSNMAVDPGNTANNPMDFIVQPANSLVETAFLFHPSMLVSLIQDKGVKVFEWIGFVDQFGSGADWVFVDFEAKGARAYSRAPAQLGSAWGYVSVSNVSVKEGVPYGDVSVQAIGFDAPLPGSSHSLPKAMKTAMTVPPYDMTGFEIPILPASFTEFVNSAITVTETDLTYLQVILRLGADKYDSVQYRALRASYWSTEDPFDPPPPCLHLCPGKRDEKKFEYSGLLASRMDSQSKHTGGNGDDPYGIFEGENLESWNRIYLDRVEGLSFWGSGSDKQDFCPKKWALHYSKADGSLMVDISIPRWLTDYEWGVTIPEGAVSAAIGFVDEDYEDNEGLANLPAHSTAGCKFAFRLEKCSP